MTTILKTSVAAIIAAAALLIPRTGYAQELDHCSSVVEFTEASQTSPTASTAHVTVRFTEMVTYGIDGQPNCATQGANGFLVTVNGVDQTHYFNEVQPPVGEHVVTWDAPGLPLSIGSNQIAAFVNEASTYCSAPRLVRHEVT